MGWGGLQGKEHFSQNIGHCEPPISNAFFLMFKNGLSLIRGDSNTINKRKIKKIVQAFLKI